MSGRSDPQGLDPDMDPWSKLRITYRVSGGPLAPWTIEGTIVASEMLRLDGQTIELRQLIQADTVD